MRRILSLLALAAVVLLAGTVLAQNKVVVVPLGSSSGSFIPVVVFEAGWQNFGGEFPPAGYYKDRDGFVHLRGVVKLGAVYTIVFTLPPGYRPAYRSTFACVTGSNTIGRVDVNADGWVVPIDGNMDFVSLDGISFKAEL